MDTKQFQAEGIRWFKAAVEPRLVGKYETKYTSATNGDFGALEAVEFNSEKNGGYVHFWSNGYIAFELVSYESGDDIVEDTLIEWKESSKNFDDVLAPLLNGLKRSQQT